MKRFTLVLMFVVVGSGLAMVQGCSGTQTETIQRTSTTGTPEDAPATTTTTTDTTKTEEHDSVLGATANAVGTVVAAPFRLVGDAFEIVF